MLSFVKDEDPILYVERYQSKLPPEYIPSNIFPHTLPVTFPFLPLDPETGCGQAFLRNAIIKAVLQWKIHPDTDTTSEH